MSNHGDALQLTYGRLILIASRLGITPEEVAINILATMRGEISHKKPRGADSFEVRIKRVEAEPELKWAEAPNVPLPLGEKKDR